MEKKKPLTPEEKAECAALKSIFVSKKKELGLTQESFGAALGMSQAGVSHYLNGINALNLPMAIKAAAALRVSVADFSQRLAVQLPADSQPQERKPSYELIPIEEWDDDTPLDDDTVELPLYKSVEFSAGAGKSQHVEIDEGRRLRYGKRTLRKAGIDLAHAAGALNKGNSNEPVYPDGSIVMMDLSKTEIVPGEPYGIDHHGEFRAKVLYPLSGGGLRVHSYNEKEYPDEIYGPDWPTFIRVIGWIWIHQPPARRWRGR